MRITVSVSRQTNLAALLASVVAVAVFAAAAGGAAHAGSVLRVDAGAVNYFHVTLTTIVRIPPAFR